MEELRRYTPEEMERARKWLLDPPPGSRAAAARDFGIDLTLLISQLQRTPAERARKGESMAQFVNRYLGAARKSK